MPRPSIYGGESVFTASRIRLGARQAAEDLAADMDTAVARLMADALELYLADRVPGYEPVLMVDEETRQDVLDVG